MKGIGIDIVRIDRMSTLNEYALQRIFHPAEVAQAHSLEGDARLEFLSGRYAAKEAFAKALGTGLRGIKPSEVLVRNRENGSPEMVLFGETQAKWGQMKILVSISHDKPSAVAVVLVE
jgi:holo-[acyl-carrier protein] synthase